MMTGVRPSSLALVVLASCGTDTFETNDGGADASTDVADASADTVTTPDVIGKDAIVITDSPGGTFCTFHSMDIFCDDFDEPADALPWSKWDSRTPSASTTAIVFSAGTPGRALQAT